MTTRGVLGTCTILINNTAPTKYLLFTVCSSSQHKQVVTVWLAEKNKTNEIRKYDNAKKAQSVKKEVGVKMTERGEKKHVNETQHKNKEDTNKVTGQMLYRSVTSPITAQ